jgi:hypothetical protein
MMLPEIKNEILVLHVKPSGNIFISDQEKERYHGDDRKPMNILFERPFFDRTRMMR